MKPRKPSEIQLGHEVDMTGEPTVLGALPPFTPDVDVSSSLGPTITGPSKRKTAYEIAMDACDKVLGETQEDAGRKYRACMDNARAAAKRAGGEKAREFAESEGARFCTATYEEDMKAAKDDHEVNQKLVEKVFGDSKPK